MNLKTQIEEIAKQMVPSEFRFEIDDMVNFTVICDPKEGEEKGSCSGIFFDPEVQYKVEDIMFNVKEVVNSLKTYEMLFTDQKKSIKDRVRLESVKNALDDAERHNLLRTLIQVAAAHNLEQKKTNS